MEYFFPNQLGVLMYTLAVGIAAAVLYDVILIKRSVFGASGIVMFAEDFLFCLVTYALLTLCVLKANYGMMRWYEIMCPFLSFTLYRMSASQFTVKAGTALLKTLIAAVVFVVKTFAVKPFAALVCAVIVLQKKLSVKSKAKKAKRFSDRMRAVIVKDASQGFNIDGK